MKNIHDGYITRNKEVMMGKPCIKGTRITVEMILSKMSEGATVEQLMEDYPGLTKESIQACFDYVKAIMLHEEVIEITT